MLYSSLGKPRGHFQPLSSNIAGAVSTLAHMLDTAITHGKSKSVSKHSMCQLVFIFRHFPKDIFGPTSHILRWLDLIISFKAAGVCRENMQPNHLINLFLFLHTLEYLGTVYPLQTNTFTSPVQPASGVSQKNQLVWMNKSVECFQSYSLGDTSTKRIPFQ